MRIAPSASLLLFAATSVMTGCSAGSHSATLPGTSIPNAAAAHTSLFSTKNGVLLPRGFNLPRLSNATTGGWLSPYAKAGKNVVYVADQGGGAIEIYKQKGTNQQPIGKITQGLVGVDGLFVDRKRQLYATNFGNGTVTVYKAGSTSPFETLTGAGSPLDVVAALDGTVYVSNYNSNTNGTVLEYPKGQTTPSKTIVTFGANSFPEGLAIDSKGNLYVAFNANDGEVMEFPPNSSSGTNLGIHVRYVGGLTIDNNDNLLLVDQNLPGVDVYPQGSTTPSQVITGFALAFDVAINKKNKEIFVSTPFNPPSVSGVSYPAGTIVDTITAGLSSAFGVATSPDGTD
jgi:sugar lactone lactonase YvrE